MTPLVTIVLPVYKRLEFLPKALESVRAQDYPAIELIVSANGQNGPRIRELVEKHYGKPHVFRENETTVPAVEHYNQLVGKATGKYFLMLCDDDEISPNFVSELAASLEDHPEAAVAIGRQEIIDGTGRILRASSLSVPGTMSDEEFIRAWRRNDNQYECWVTHLVRTSEAQDCGGYHPSPRGTFCEDILLLKLLLGRSVVFNTRCAFRWRIADDTSFGWSMTCEGLARDVRLLLRYLRDDARFREFGRNHPKRWANMRADLSQIVWMIFFWRWDSIYRYRLSRAEWCRIGLSMPWVPAYYRKALPLIVAAKKDGLVSWFRKHSPWVLRVYQVFRHGFRHEEPKCEPPVKPIGRSS